MGILGTFFCNGVFLKEQTDNPQPATDNSQPEKQFNYLLSKYVFRLYSPVSKSFPIARSIP